MHLRRVTSAQTLNSTPSIGYATSSGVGVVSCTLAAAFLVGAILYGSPALAENATDTVSGAVWDLQTEPSTTPSLIDPAEHLQSRQADSTSHHGGTFVPRWVQPSSEPDSSFGPSPVKQASAQLELPEEPSIIVDQGPSLSDQYVQNEPILTDPPEMIAPGNIVPFDQYDGYESNVGCADGDCGFSGGCLDEPCGCDVCTGPCYPCWTPFRDRLWVRADYLRWWTKGFNVPPLVTTSSDDPIVLGTSGALGNLNTTILFGNDRLNSDARSGGRISFGYWLDPCKLAAIEATYFGLNDESTTFQATSDVARPFFDVPGRAEAAWPVDVTGLVDGAIDISATTELHSFEVLLRRALPAEYCSRLDFVVGYRYARLNDDLRIAQQGSSVDVNAFFPAGQTVEMLDLFETENEFHGAELGLVAEMRHCRWTLEMLMKLSLGGTESRVNIDGGTLVDGVPRVAAGGMLTQGSNIGTYVRDEFTMIPELGVTLGYDLTCRTRFMFGYSFLYWSKVARPGDQIDLALDLDYGTVPPQQAAGAMHPEFSFATTDFWAQGLSFGLDHRF